MSQNPRHCRAKPTHLPDVPPVAHRFRTELVAGAAATVLVDVVEAAAHHVLVAAALGRDGGAGTATTLLLGAAVQEHILDLVVELVVLAAASVAVEAAHLVVETDVPSVACRVRAELVAGAAAAVLVDVGEATANDLSACGACRRGCGTCAATTLLDSVARELEVGVRIADAV